ncbi:MAG TPA: tetratricopeptide repeat protein [Hydrogenothermaceae bacterium]|nr:tetratricopeptide repeat protein [Hydrogenothermaceae bacterium]
MKKEKLPIEENVDIEFEYKLLHFYDRVKPYLKFIIAGFILAVLMLIALIYQKSKEKEFLNNAGAKVYEISELISSKKFSEATKLIAEFKKTYADTPYIKLINVYEIQIQRQQNKNIDKKLVQKTKNLFNTDQLKAFYTEFEGFLNFKEKKYTEAKQNLENVKQNHFNYLSALLLKGIILEKTGEKNKAKTAFEEVRELSKNKFKYFYDITNN